MRSVARPRAFHAIVEQIRNDIFQGRRKPGDRLPPEQVLAEQFNVSRTGVREALRVLESQGLVRIRHGYAGGVFVDDAGMPPVLGALETLLRLGQVEVSELYQARVLFEPTLARLAVERGDEISMKHLDDNIRRAKAALAAGRDAYAINLGFHTILAQASGNRVLGLVMQALLELLHGPDRSYPTNQSISRKAVNDHVQLLEAIRGHDTARAEHLMVRHLGDLKGRFAVIQQQMRRARSAGEQAIPTWGGMRLEPTVVRHSADEDR
jgi:GntR family transcriptional regulator, transcriptional repressor for pyruvate dehydrogenase complex